MKTKLLKHLETIAIVTLVSVLVWLYAEGETVQQFEGTLRIELAAPPGKEMAVEPSGPQVVRVVYRAATSQLPRFNQAITTPIAVSLSAHQQSLDLREALRDHFTPMGIEIIDARTEENADTIPVRAEPLRRLDMPVEAQTTGVEGVVINVIDITPRTVGVTMPESLIDTARDLELQVRMADLAGGTGSAATGPLRVGRDTRPMSIRLPEALNRPEDRPHVRLGRSTADVTFEVRRLTTTYEMADPIPITLRVAPDVLGRAEVTIDGRPRGTVGPLTLEGPRSAIADIREGRVEIAAVVDLTDPEHFAAIDQQREIEMPVVLQGLPPEVVLRNPESTPEVTVTIRPRNQTP